MSKPQVTLTFAGDSTKLETAFDKVGSSARRMETDVGTASRSVGESADGFDKASVAADGTYSKMDALESVGRGTTDTMSGLGEIMKGNVLQGSTDLAGGLAALADGFSGALLPAIKAAASGGIAHAAATVKSTAALAVNKVATFGSAVATNAMTVAQKALNLAMRMNPIGLIITGLLLLTAGVVWAYKNVGWFRSAVDTAMKGVKAAFGWAIEAGGKLVGWVKDLPGKVGEFLNKVPAAGKTMLKWFQDLPGKIGGYFKGLGDIVSKPFTAAFSAIKSFWNNTVGGKGFTVPGWIPGVGGKSFTIPMFHQGGIMPGAPGSEGLALLQAGERITPTNQVGQESQPAGDTIVYITIDGEQLQGRITKTVRTSNRELKRTVKAAA
jgi:hypothetical protein